MDAEHLQCICKVYAILQYANKTRVSPLQVAPIHSVISRKEEIGINWGFFSKKCQTPAWHSGG